MHDEQLFDNWHLKRLQIQVLKNQSFASFDLFLFSDESSDDNDLQSVVKQPLQRKIDYHSFL